MQSIAERNLAAGDLIFCNLCGRAGFAKTAVSTGEEFTLVDDGRFIIRLAPHSVQPHEGAQVNLLPTGAPSLAAGDPVGTIARVVDLEGLTVAVDLNV